MKPIKPCPFCGSENLSVGSFGNYIKCKNCGTAGPDGSTLNEAFDKWNSAPRKEDVEIKKSCGNCVHISKEVDGKVYCCEEININHSCKYWEALNPFGNSRSTCLDCKHRYYSWGGDNICNYCGHEIGNPEGYVCDKWEAKEPEPAPLNPSNPNELEPFILEAKDELKYIQQKESTHNQMQQLAEEAAELAQAALKFNRMMGCGCYTPVNPKDARDAVIEETADVLLCLEAAFPHRPGNMGFYSNLARIYQEKAKRWAERLKDHDD